MVPLTFSADMHKNLSAETSRTAAVTQPKLRRQPGRNPAVFPDIVHQAKTHNLLNHKVVLPSVYSCSMHTSVLVILMCKHLCREADLLFLNDFNIMKGQDQTHFHSNKKVTYPSQRNLWNQSEVESFTAGT